MFHVRSAVTLLVVVKSGCSPIRPCLLCKSSIIATYGAMAPAVEAGVFLAI